MDRDLSEMNWFGYAGGLWLFPKLGEAWVDQMLPVAGNRLDLGEGRMCWERQTVLRLLKKKKKKGLSAAKLELLPIALVIFL